MAFQSNILVMMVQLTFSYFSAKTVKAPKNADMIICKDYSDVPKGAQPHLHYFTMNMEEILIYGHRFKWRDAQGKDLHDEDEY